jgi:hypothetical protein
MISQASEFVLKVRKHIAEGAVLVLLVAASPTVNAMSLVEGRQRRASVQSEFTDYRRRRALTRQYGGGTVIYALSPGVF